MGNYGGFPTTGSAYDKTYNGGTDLGIAKLNPSGSSLLWSTYLGGNSNDGGSALAIDLSGAVVVGGSTMSTDFPTTSSAYRRTPIALGDLFLSVIGPEGDKLLYSTYFGGSGIYETLYGIALDGLGRAYMTGFTDSPDFPTTAGAFDRTLGGTGDAFVARLDPTLPGVVALGFGTYLGGSGANDTGHAIKLGPGDEPIVLGYTDSIDLPGADTGYDGTIGGSDDMFVARLSNDGSSAPYVSYLGGLSSESLGPDSLEVDDFGRAHVGAETYSASYPSTAGAITACTSGGQVVYTVLDTEVGGAGSLVTSTCAGPAWGLGIGIDGCGRAAITGFTASAAYPTVGGYSASLGGTRDAFLMEISPSSGTGPADLAVSVSDSPDPIFVGQGVTHTIQVTNNGPNAATGVRVTHRMSALVTVASLPPECTGSGASVVCDLGTIPSGTTVPLAIAATAPLPRLAVGHLEGQLRQRRSRLLGQRRHGRHDGQERHAEPRRPERRHDLRERVDGFHRLDGPRNRGHVQSRLHRGQRGHVGLDRKGGRGKDLLLAGARDQGEQAEVEGPHQGVRRPRQGGGIGCLGCRLRHRGGAAHLAERRRGPGVGG